MIGVDRPAGDRRHRVLELGCLVEPIGVEADRDVARVGVAERGVDQLRRGAVVLVDLEAHRAGLEQDVQRRRIGRARVGLEPDVHREALEATKRPLHPRGGSLKPR